MAKFTCFDLDLYTNDHEIPTISQEIVGPNTEVAAETFARYRHWNSAGGQPFPMQVVVMSDGLREIWEVELEMIPLYKTSLQESIVEGSDDDF